MKITDYLQSQNVQFETRQHPPAYTAQEVAAEEHVSGRTLAKAVVVRADDSYALCVLPAHRKLDMEKAAAALNAQQVFLADEMDLAKLFPDAEVGAEPPFGNLYNLPTVADNQLASEEFIIFQAGTHRQAIRMRFDDYRCLVNPLLADISVGL